jgi:predicted nucleotidyltransferase component of viral defense system
MIPQDYITQWRKVAPWADNAQVEQDLVISRALVEIFSNPTLKDALAFRGGTALYKLFMKPPARYSEDIDLVQIRAEPAGEIMGALQDLLNPWLGKPKYKQTQGRVTFVYRFDSEDQPPLPLKLKVEINTREHFSVYGITAHPFEVSSRWFEGACDIGCYELDELLGTKLRALYQRKKGRDLLDLAIALEETSADPTRILECFAKYMEQGSYRVSRAEFERNIHLKLQDKGFTSDMSPLLATGRSWDLEKAVELVSKNLIEVIPGDPWKGEG